MDQADDLSPVARRLATDHERDSFTRFSANAIGVSDDLFTFRCHTYGPISLDAEVVLRGTEPGSHLFDGPECPLNILLVVEEGHIHADLAWEILSCEDSQIGQRLVEICGVLNAEGDDAAPLLVAGWSQDLEPHFLEAVEELSGKSSDVMPNGVRSQLVDDAQTGKRCHQTCPVVYATLQSPCIIVKMHAVDIESGRSTSTHPPHQRGRSKLEQILAHVEETGAQGTSQTN